MKLKTVTRGMATITLTMEPEIGPFEGDFDDRETEEWIRSELASDNQWAWCVVTVTAKWGGFEGSDHLGGCSYKSEEDFRQPGGYFDDMVKAALETLNQSIRDAAAKLETLIEEG